MLGVLVIRSKFHKESFRLRSNFATIAAFAICNPKKPVKCYHADNDIPACHAIQKHLHRYAVNTSLFNRSQMTMAHAASIVIFTVLPK